MAPSLFLCVNYTNAEFKILQIRIIILHELGIVQELINLAEQELLKAEFEGQVSEVTVKVGRLSGANPEALRFAFEAVVSQSRLEGASLNIVEINPLCKCSECGSEQEIAEYIFVCPACGSHNILISGGTDLNLESLEVEDK